MKSTISKHHYYSTSSSSGSLPIILATTGVNNTVGGNLMGLAALCAAYDIATVPALSTAPEFSIPTFANREPTSTPLSTKT
mmetsp:Transcript_30652/g.35237  ORF Transcript_30652/g.35237 Transcript_30652/m.35237 type:complete len:81 (-) Transcript_30652:567-809(-)